MNRVLLATALATVALGSVTGALASSHREAPLITKFPKVDATDFYMFRSYEPGREGYVTFIANYQPFQEPFAGPNYYMFDDRATYEINIDNNGDAAADITYEFQFTNIVRNLTVPVGGANVPVPLINIGPFGSTELSENQNVYETYQLAVRNGGTRTLARNVRANSDVFIKPTDNIGNKSIADYPTYADRFVYRAALPGCNAEARVFVGQRRESFAANVGEIFDLINTNPVGARASVPNPLFAKNISTIAVEVPIDCVVAGSPIIGAWTSARVTAGTTSEQVSRLSSPLVNEVIVGLPDKDRFNASMPVNDSQFATYVTNPTLPKLIEILFPGVQAPTNFPRTDLVAAFLTGVQGLNQPANVRPAEMMRLNTSIAPTPLMAQRSLAVIDGDFAGFPNGRRPGDDVVDIELRVAMGVLLTDSQAPSRRLEYTDGTWVNSTFFRGSFPYLQHPVPGSPYARSIPQQG